MKCWLVTAKDSIQIYQQMPTLEDIYMETWGCYIVMLRTKRFCKFPTYFVHTNVVLANYMRNSNAI